MQRGLERGLHPPILATVLLLCCYADVVMCCCSVHLANVLVWSRQGWHTGHWPVCGSGHSADSSVQLRQCAAVWPLAPVTSVLQHWSEGCLQFFPVCSWQCAECSVEVWGERAMCRPPQCGTLPNSLLLSAHCTLLKDTTLCCLGMCSEVHWRSVHCWSHCCSGILTALTSTQHITTSA